MIEWKRIQKMRIFGKKRKKKMNLRIVMKIGSLEKMAFDIQKDLEFMRRMFLESWMN